MWAQDATAMYGYAASSAVATALSRFSAPPNTTTPSSLGNQAAAVAQSAATPAGNSAQSLTATIPQLLSSASLPQAAQQFATAAGAPTLLEEIETQYQNFIATWLPTPSSSWWQLVPANYTTVLKQTLQAYFGVGIGNFGWSIGQQTQRGLGATAGAGGAWYATPQFAALGAGGWGFHAAHLGPGTAAGLGSATKVGALSVPSAWGGTPGAPEGTGAAATKLVSAQFSASGGDVDPANGVNAALRGLPAGGTGGAQRGTGPGVRYGIRYKVLAQPPSAG
jgi:PPE-repeat protein